MLRVDFFSVLYHNNHSTKVLGYAVS